MPTSINSSGITFPNGTTQTTAASGGVTSLNGQTGAITNTGSGVIGSYTSGGPQSSTTYTIGSTVAGSLLRQSTNANINAFQNIDVAGSNYYNPGLTGTWRAMARSSFGNECGALRFIGPNLWVRIS